MLYLFDLPIYRLPEAKYYASRNAHVDRIMTASPLPTTPSHPSQASQLAPQDQHAFSRLCHRYGGAWQFNEIIGYLRIHLVGTQVRAELWRTCCKRVVRTRTKVFELRSHKLVPETDLPIHGTNVEIFASVTKHIEACRKQLHPSVLDAEQLETLGKHVDWKALVFG